MNHFLNHIAIIIRIKHNHVTKYPKDGYASFERKLTSILSKEQALKKFNNAFMLFKVLSTAYCH